MTVRAIKPQIHRRKRLLIDRPVQGRIVTSISWPPAVSLIVVSVLLCMFAFRLTAEAMEAGVDLPSIFPLLITTGGFLLVSLGFLLFNALKISHRIVGPLFRIRVTLDAVRQGQLDARARIRSNDYLLEFADSINEFLDWVEATNGKQDESSAEATDPSRDSADAKDESAIPDPAPLG